MHCVRWIKLIQHDALSSPSVCRRSTDKEALQFRTAERMVYESNLLRIVKTDAEKEAAEVAAAAKADSTPVSPSHSSSSSSSSSTTSPTHRNLHIMHMKSADPTPIIRTPITPKSLIADEERALTYERLAKVFFDEKNLDMAKSYALKAIELRRRIKAKWGDPSKMDTDQLLLHQLAVMGQEQYEQTLRRFRGEEPKEDASHDEEDEELKESDAAASSSSSSTAAARDRALKYSMAKSLQALSSGTKDAAAATLRKRQKAATKKVAFQSEPDAAASSAAVAAPADASDPTDVSFVVLERPPAFNQRALFISLAVALLFVLLAWYLITRTFHETFFPLRSTNRFGPGAPK
jgi:hypothetical protein